MRGLGSHDPLVRGVAGVIAVGSITGVRLTYKTEPVVTVTPRRVSRIANVYSKLGLGVNAPSRRHFRTVHVTTEVTTGGGVPVILSLININIDHFEVSFIVDLLSRIRISIVGNGLSRIGTIVRRNEYSNNIRIASATTRSSTGTLTYETTLRCNYVYIVANRASCITRLYSRTNYCSGGREDLVDASTVNANIVSGYMIGTITSSTSKCARGCEMKDVANNRPVVGEIANAKYVLSKLVYTFTTTSYSSGCNTIATTLDYVGDTNKLTTSSVTRRNERAGDYCFVGPKGTMCQSELVSTMCRVYSNSCRLV